MTTPYTKDQEGKLNEALRYTLTADRLRASGDKARAARMDQEAQEFLDQVAAERRDVNPSLLVRAWRWLVANPQPEPHNHQEDR